MQKERSKKLKSNENTSTILNNHLKRHWIFYLLMVLLISLLFKNPYSGKNSISNLDPYPDALMYLTAAKGLTEGAGLQIYYKSVKLDSTIPPLYPAAIAPFYFIFRDPRAFYFANILLTLASSLFFYRIIFKLFQDEKVKATLFLAFVSNFIIFWYPSVAMAENLLICLFIISTYLLLDSPTGKKSLYLGLLTTSFFATKYVAWTLSFSLGLTFTIFLFSQKLRQVQKFKLFSLYLLASGASFIILMLLESSTKEQNIFNQLELYFQHIPATINSIGADWSVHSSGAHSSLTFSQSYLKTNLLRYFAGLIGGPAPAAGKDFITIPIVIGMSSLLGIFINLFFSRLRVLSFYFLIVFLTTLSYILFFFKTDNRYLFVIIPIQIIVFGISLSTLLSFLNKKKLFLSSHLITFVILSAIVLSVSPVISNQLKLNFYDGENSRSYQTVMFYNQTFRESKPGKKPNIISTIPPLMVDFYSNKNYNLLPFSGYQHFMYKPEIWDIPNNSNLFELYKQYLEDGREIYLSDHDANNPSFYSFAYLFYKENFELIPISTGCHNQCNIFKLELKSAANSLR